MDRQSVNYVLFVIHPKVPKHVIPIYHTYLKLTRKMRDMYIIWENMQQKDKDNLVAKARKVSVMRVVLPFHRVSKHSAAFLPLYN